MAELSELQRAMALAITNNDVKAMEDIAGQIVKGKTDRHKAEAEAMAKEAEALAGVREKLTEKIKGVVIGSIGKAFTDKDKVNQLNAELEAVKAKGYKILYDMGLNIITCSLDVPTVKASRTGRTSTTGKSKDEFGLSLQAIFDKFATSEDRVKLTEAEIKDADIKVKTGKSNQVNQYNVKLGVKKAAIAAGLLAPVK